MTEREERRKIGEKVDEIEFLYRQRERERGGGGRKGGIEMGKGARTRRKSKGPMSPQCSRDAIIAEEATAPSRAHTHTHAQERKR